MENVSIWWNFIGVAIAVLGVIVSLKQNKNKKLSYSLNLYPIFEIRNDLLKSDLEIRYKNEIIKQIYICVITIKNFGTLSIRKEDFDEPIVFKFKNCKHVFSIENIDSSPENLNVQIDIKSNQNIVKINPILLNPTDFFSLKLILEGEEISSEINSRIDGVKEIQNQIDIQNKSNQIKNVFLFICGIVVMIFAEDFISNVDFLVATYLASVFCIAFGLSSTISFIKLFLKK